VGTLHQPCLPTTTLDGETERGGEKKGDYEKKETWIRERE
jgi:hypothetical protein